MNKDSLVRKINEEQSVQKFSLLTAASLLIPSGISLCQSGLNSWAGIALVVLGVVLLLTRELIKLRK